MYIVLMISNKKSSYKKNSNNCNKSGFISFDFSNNYNKSGFISFDLSNNFNKS